MPGNFRNWVVFSLLGSLLPLGCSPGEDSGELDTDTDLPDCETGLDIGQCPPDLTLLNRSSAPVSFSDYAGQVILINCSAMW